MLRKLIYTIVKNIFDKSICDTEKKSLICQKANTLTIIRGKSTYDAYYIRYGYVHSIIEYFCAQNKVCSQYFERGILIPRAYFEIADLLHLNIDKETYIIISVWWLENRADTVFYNKILQKYLPKNIPEKWGNIEEEILQKYIGEWTKSKEYDSKCGAYADLFIINGAGCFITGYGKSKACRKIADEELVTDLVSIRGIDGQVYGTAGAFGGSPMLKEVDYCIHMCSPNEAAIQNIIELDLQEYLRYAEENIRQSSTIRSFYNIFKDSQTKYLLVPYYENFEDKSKEIKKYIEKKLYFGL